ncbi:MULTISPECIES: polyhydroxyalkanoate synthesis repressor PhaR [unclassified Lentilitoribacter]|jgi:polyhydroxyalkanoate synthesis repressor PhaR|uniref:polyhydroxyalkanoate synthesis repressor PhaR n=1 Tax=unclassified Lentilitoribacter TaxID=2647570 RepID=UPI0013A6C78F|nr:polyhydroxyalkanoate synthesis repressor PhaR [Lentilitoribacter sp. Alg239-R112]
MSKDTDAIVIKKYANRRLYNTGTSAYVTLEDLAEMVQKGEDFTVNEAKTGEDITHSVLTQIIFEQEAKTGNTLLPTSFLRQLISFYGDQMQMVVPSYLEHSMSALTEQQEKFKEQMTSSMEANPVIANMAAPMQLIEEQVKKNTEMFQQAMSMFSPFAMSPEGEEKKDEAKSEIDELKEQLKGMQDKINKIS